MNAANYMLEQLAAWGVERIYGVVGDAIFDLADALSRQDRIRFIPCRHEAAAAFMASAEAKLTGQPEVCIATSGPGMTNLITGLGDAYADRVPVLAITGQSPTAKLGTLYKQDINQQQLLSGLAGYTALLAAPAALPQQLALAWRAALSGQVGHISVPKDLFTQPLGQGADGRRWVRGPEPYLQAPPVPDPVTLDGAVSMLNAARRPVILAGHGALPAAQDLVWLAEHWGAPVITALAAKGLIPFQHPLALGGLGQGGYEEATQALSAADLVLAVCTNWWPDAYVPGGAAPAGAAAGDAATAPGAAAGARPRIVRIDRYPANIGARAPVDYGLAGDVRAIIPQLNAALQPQTEPAWRDQVAEWRAALLRTAGAERAGRAEGAAAPGVAGAAGAAGAGAADAPGCGLHPAFVMQCLEEALPPDAIVTLDTGDHTVWFNRSFGGERHRVLVSGTWRSLGFGLPAALAAKLVAPDRTVAAVVGDGGITSLLGELLTAARHRIPVLIAVVNNGMYAMEYNGMVRHGLQPLGTDLNNPDFARLAEACGLTGLRVQKPRDLAPALQQALAMERPVLLDIATQPVPLPGPKS